MRLSRAEPAAVGSFVSYRKEQAVEREDVFDFAPASQTLFAIGCIGLVLMLAAIGAGIYLLSALFLRGPARREELKKAMGYCQSCGYNLYGNVSGICPECGTPTLHDAESSRDETAK